MDLSMPAELSESERIADPDYKAGENPYIRRSVVIVLLCLCTIARSQDESANRPPHSWRASWITSPEAPRKEECILRFRKELALESVPQHYIIHVSADNQFLLVVNGSIVGTGPSHSDLQHWKYETYD